MHAERQGEVPSLPGSAEEFMRVLREKLKSFSKIRPTQGARGKLGSIFA